MLEQIFTYFTIDIIYIWLNIGVIPFWLMLIFFPTSKICNIFVSSIFPIIIFSAIYLYLVYFFFLSDYDFLGNFILYLSLDDLKLPCFSLEVCGVAASLFDKLSNRN